MSVNGVTGMAQTYDSKGTSRSSANQSKNANEAKQQDTDAVIYDKSETVTAVSANKVYQRDQAAIDRLWAEAEKRSQSLRDLVEKMLLKQGQAYTDSTDIYALLREGKLTVDPEVQEQAKKEIAEDGYWGIEQTSERLLSFAKALSGGDPSKADELIEAIKKGFEEAAGAWGGELPDICRKTVDAAITKLEAWRDSSVSSSSDE